MSRSTPENTGCIEICVCGTTVLWLKDGLPYQDVPRYTILLLLKQSIVILDSILIDKGEIPIGLFEDLQGLSWILLLKNIIEISHCQFNS